MNQLEKVDAGEITLDGAKMREMKNGKIEYASSRTLREITLRMGMVFQSFNYFWACGKGKTERKVKKT